MSLGKAQHSKHGGQCDSSRIGTAEAQQRADMALLSSLVSDLIDVQMQTASFDVQVQTASFGVW
jgi:hypothetical protein